MSFLSYILIGLSMFWVGLMGYWVWFVERRERRLQAEVRRRGDALGRLEVALRSAGLRTDAAWFDPRFVSDAEHYIAVLRARASRKKLPVRS